MKNTAKILAFIIAFSFMGCNSHAKKHATVTLSQSQIKKYESIFKDLKEHLVKDSAEKLWNYPLYGPMIFVNPKTRVVIANEPDNKVLLVKEGSVYAGILPKSVLIADMRVYNISDYLSDKIEVHRCLFRSNNTHIAQASFSTL